MRLGQALRIGGVDGDEKYLFGTVVLPWDARFEDAIGTSLWLTVPAELGEESVVRYRMLTGSQHTRYA